MSSEIIALICRTYKEVLGSQGHDLEKPENINVNTPIHGGRGYLDSLGLVSLIVALEENMREKLNISVSIVNERVMSDRDNIFKTVGSLADHISLLLKEDSNNE